MSESNSIGLRYRGEVVGWVITHRINELLWRYSCAFVREDLARKRIGLALMKESMSRQVEVVGLDAVHAIWNVPNWHSTHARFIRRRVAPYLISLTETMGSFKQLRK